MSTSITPQEFITLISRCDVSPQSLAVAVSGGADSMALCLLAHAWARENGSRMVALTVDHRLRAESAAEARQVKDWLAARGIQQHILIWEHGEISGNLQQAARDARYRLMTEWCKKHAVGTLLVAHTLEDQAETFLLRLARGSGVDGLSAMAPTAEKNGVRILRPLLDTSKAQIIATLKALSQEWLEDPSNNDSDFDRVKFRQAQDELSKLGLTPARLAQTAKAMRSARQALEAATEKLFEAAVQQRNERVTLNLALLLAAEQDVAYRVLQRLIKYVASPANMPRFEELARLYAHMQGHGAGCTLGHCRFQPSKRKDEAHLWLVSCQKNLSPPLKRTG